MSDERDELKLKIKQAEAAVAHAQKVYNEAEPGSVKDSCLQLLLAKEASLLAKEKALDSCLQLLLAKEKALEQMREKDLLQQRAAAGAGDNHSLTFLRSQESCIVLFHAEPGDCLRKAA